MTEQAMKLPDGLAIGRDRVAAAPRLARWRARPLRLPATAACSIAVYRRLCGRLPKAR